MPIYRKIFLYKGMNKLVCLKTLMHITSCSRDSPDSRDCRYSRETLKYCTFGREKFWFRAMSQRIWKLCVASLLIILCFPVGHSTLLDVQHYFLTFIISETSEHGILKVSYNNPTWSFPQIFGTKIRIESQMFSDFFKVSQWTKTYATMASLKANC